MYIGFPRLLNHANCPFHSYYSTVLLVSLITILATVSSSFYACAGPPYPSSLFLLLARSLLSVRGPLFSTPYRCMMHRFYNWRAGGSVWRRYVWEHLHLVAAVQHDLEDYMYANLRVLR